MNATYNVTAVKDAMLQHSSVLKQEYPWYRSLADKFPHLHPIVVKAIELAPPDTLESMVFERPHVSEKDALRLAYTRNHDHGERDVQTVTSLGKYIRARFSTLSDHQIRDLVALNVPDSVTFKLVHTTEEMIHHLEEGPVSCMQRGKDEFKNQWHPYRTYDPKFGWHMAVRLVNGVTKGRALCNTSTTYHIDPRTDKRFVRTYAMNEGTGYSQADHALEAWLVEQGYEHQCGWSGRKLAYIASGDSFVAPYIDGDSQSVDTCSGPHLVIRDDGEYLCNNTDGTPEDNNKVNCVCCDDICDEDDMTYVEDVEGSVCSHCLDNNFAYAYSRRGNREYVRCEHVSWYMDDAYHNDYLDDNEMVILHDGELCPMDDAIYIDSENEYYACGDEAVITRADDESDIIDNCWYCELSKHWYSDDDSDKARDLADGRTAHIDNIDGEPLADHAEQSFLPVGKTDETPCEWVADTYHYPVTQSTTQQEVTL
jgi:hypothetical protein